MLMTESGRKVVCVSEQIPITSTARQQLLSPEFKPTPEITISGACLPNKDYRVLRSTVYYFIKCFLGKGDLEVKLLALCGKVMTFDNFGAYLFHLPTPPRPRTCGGMEAGKPGPDRVQHCCGAASSPSPSFPFSLSLPLPLSLFFSPLNKTDLN